MKAIAAKESESKNRSNWIALGLAISLFVVITLALAAFIHVEKWGNYDREALNRASEQRVLSQQVAKYILAASSGEKEAFKKLRQASKRFDVLISELRNGSGNKLPKAPDEIIPKLDELEAEWKKLGGTAKQILKAEASITSVDEWVNVILNELMPKLEKYSDLVATGMTAYAEPTQIYFATKQLMLAQRIQQNVNQVLSGGVSKDDTLKKFKEDSEFFGRVLDGMLVGDKKFGLVRVDSLKITDKKRLAKLKKSLGNASMSFSSFKEFSQRIIETAPKVLPALQVAGASTKISDSLDAKTVQLIQAYDLSPGRLSVAGIKVDTNIIIVLGGLSVLILIALGANILLDAKRRERLSEEMSQRQQKAILRLMDEMDDLADGDLTFHCTVTEDDTGAIADAINNAIETLRRLVATINNTSDQVSSSAQETRGTALHLADASEHQAVQISAASRAVQDMAESIEQVSQVASETANTSAQSLETANKGAEKVRSTIQGMDGIREQIQETSKRIKRLGESSQEIGDIVELIDDIADQTNILALNAAMQAAMAGDAGRGFAVVADEVQRLAERSSNATKQIEALVKTIQADTNEAVASMELSTSGVVNGAKLAEDAGEALQEIEHVFKKVVDFTQRISGAAGQQATVASNISDTMNVIQEITKQTSDGTHQTTKSVGRLADLADDLQKSVSGFRLPA
ncbi:MAG: chemotaxis protein [Methylococcales bacterium]|jgi:twitching motility protein PilJ|nr:chemotaxis protein [Methylococcales bacterium]